MALLTLCFEVEDDNESDDVEVVKVDEAWKLDFFFF